VEQRCTTCGAQLQPDALYCPACGDGVPPQVFFCPWCSDEIPAGSSYCTSCGKPVRTPGVVAAATMDSSRSAPPPSPPTRNAWLTLSALAVVVAGIATALAVFGGGGSGLVSASGLDVGMCFDDATTGDTPDGLEVEEVAVVDCSVPHDNEVYLVGRLPDQPYPGGDTIDALAFDLCLAEFRGFVGRSYFTSELEIFAVSPSERAWSDGDRRVVCAVYALDLTPLEGTMAGTGR